METNPGFAKLIAKTARRATTAFHWSANGTADVQTRQPGFGRTMPAHQIGYHGGMDEPAKETKEAASSSASSLSARARHAKTLALTGWGLVAVWVVIVLGLLSSTPGHVAGAPSIDMDAVSGLCFLFFYSPVALIGLRMAISNGKIYRTIQATTVQTPENVADSPEER